MIQTLLFLLCAVLICICILPYGIYWKIRGWNDPSRVCPGGQNLVNFWYKLLLKSTGARVHRYGRENITDRTALWVGNHQGDLDIILFFNELGPLKSIVAKKETEKIPVVSMWMRLIDCIFMDRGNPRQTLECIKKVQEWLEKGRSFVIFPEGTRSQGPDMNEFKPGALRCAIKAKVPIVPFVIDGSYKTFEQQGYVKKADVNVSILPAIEPEEYEGLKTHELAAMVQQRIQDEIYRLRELDGHPTPVEERKVWNAQQNS